MHFMDNPIAAEYGDTKMYGSMMGYVAGQLSDGAVERKEFSPEQNDGEWPDSLTDEDREGIRRFIERKTPASHKLMNSSGKTCFVYMDERGRAVDSPLDEISDEHLILMAKRLKMRMGGFPRPETSRTNHGYSKPRQE